MEKVYSSVKGLLWKLVWKICMIIAQGPYFVSWRMVWVIVLVYFLLPTKHREIARANFSVVFPQYSKREIDRLVLESFRYFGLQTLLFLMLSGNNWFARRRRQAIDGGIVGEEKVEAALERVAQKRVGLICITFHLGFWEWSAIKMHEFLKQRCPAMEFSVLAFFDPAREEINIFAKIRKMLGMEVIKVGPLAPRTIIRKLREGHSVGMVVDQIRGSGKNLGKQVKLFGRTAYLPDTHFRLAQTTGAEVVIGLCLWEGRQYVLYIFEVIGVKKGTAPEEDEAFIREALEKEVRIIEQAVSEKPEQWFCVTPILEKSNNSH